MIHILYTNEIDLGREKMNVITIVKVLELRKGSYISDKIFRDLGFVKQLIGGGGYSGGIVGFHWESC